MHYIRQCLEPGRILNYRDSILEKSVTLAGNADMAKQAGMVELQLTDQCNLNCFHCHFRNQGDVFFRREWLDLVTDEILPQAVSLAGGGEPTLYPDFDGTVRKLKNGKSAPQIGLITNGVFIPPGSWPSQLSWLRVSLYSVVGGRYAGMPFPMQEKVMDNIVRYMDMDELPMLGVSLLYYKGNVADCVKLSYELYKRIKGVKREIGRFNIQYKRAFVLCDPRRMNEKNHQENLQLLPDRAELAAAASYKEELCMADAGFQEFLDICSNYSQIEDFIHGGMEEAAAQTEPSRITPQNFPHCYAVLESRLITPDGYVYPCPSIAENRDTGLALGHITDKNEVFQKRVLHYYSCGSKWCNRRFCRHSRHNELFQSLLDTGEMPEYGSSIRKDRFF